VTGLRVLCVVGFAIGGILGDLQVSLVAFSEEQGAYELSGLLISALAVGSMASGILVGDSAVSELAALEADQHPGLPDAAQPPVGIDRRRLVDGRRGRRVRVAGDVSMGKVGQALGTYGANVVDVVRSYNAATETQRGEIVPVLITIYEDRSFSLVLRTPPTSALLRRAAGLSKGSASPNGVPIATVTRAQLREVARRKLPDLNTDDLEAAMKIVVGTARSMGISVSP